MKRVFLLFFLMGFLYQSHSQEVIVFLKNGIKPSSITTQSVVKKHKNRIVLKVPNGKKLSEFIKELQKDPDIAYVLPNYKVYPQAIPNDPLYPQQWYLKNIDMENAWDITTGLNTVYVAVIDTGVDYTHPDIKANIWVNEDERKGDDANCSDGEDDDGNGYIDDCYGYDAITGKGSAMDYDGHGTNVAGIIGATTNNGIGVAGINWNVKIIPCRFMANGSGDVNDLIECLEYIKSLKNQKGLDIAVINGSYGYTAPADQTLNVDCTQYPDTEKCLIQDIGAIFVAAAGNYTSNNDINNFLPCNYSVVLDNVICVGSVDRYDNISSFSNYGVSTVNIFAPGGEVNSNQLILNLYKYTNDGDDTNDYAGFVGTSQAAPQVAGVLSLLKSIDSTSSSNAELIKKVIASGDNLLSLSGYSASCNRLNAYKAVSSPDNLPKICINKPITQDNQNFYYKVGSIETGNTKEFSFKIKSTGTGALDIGNVYLDKNSKFKITGETCSGGSFNFGQICEIRLSFKSNEEGNFSDYLNIETNTKYNTIKIKLSGSVYSPKTDTGGGGSGGCSMDTTGNYTYFEWMMLLFLLFAGRILLNRKIS
ncbi:S8 family peptidase [Persephonella sp.]|uniref:S8 family peptidase n=1 Tax=Persephonella sp. TaxID=2060922 RepID=UPI002638E074|nr:S8 family peptidase [Persephonella sp.]